MQFKIDENLPVEACAAFRDAGHDAVNVFDQRLNGKPDSNVASVCRLERRVLVTLDTDFGNILTYPPKEFSGIIVIRSEDQSKPRILGFVSRIIAALASEPPLRQLWIVEEKGIRIRGHE